MPILPETVPKPCSKLKAGDIMATDVVSMASVETVSNIAEALESGHKGFPILNDTSNLIGIIPVNYVMVLLRKQGFYRTTAGNEPIMSKSVAG
jgi:CBS-domain-containing membrane protein